MFKKCICYNDGSELKKSMESLNLPDWIEPASISKLYTMKYGQQAKIINENVGTFEDLESKNLVRLNIQW